MEPHNINSSQPNPNTSPPTPNISPEVSPQPGYEQTPKPEQAPNPEQSNQTAPLQAPISLPPVVAPQTQPSGDASATTTASDTSMPAIADDVDVIEKDWVDKAKDIIRETKDDPHAQEEAVEKLQVDYLKKRYGKDIKMSE